MYYKNILCRCSLALYFLFIFLSPACSKPQKVPDQPPSSPADTIEEQPSQQPVKTDVELWLTQADQSVLFEKQNVSLNFSNASNNNPTIIVDTTKMYQSIDGFGYCLTGGSAYLIYRLPADKRKALLQELFSTDSTFIGVSYLRVSIGASDLSRNAFSYDDIPAGQTDTTLQYFDLGADKYNLIPLLKEILKVNPNIKILGSPWSAPVWMKTNKSSKGGKLDPKYYDEYAQYFVKYIQAMQANGIH